MQSNEEISKHHENALQSVEMLRAVIGGETYPIFNNPRNTLFTIIALARTGVFT